MAEITLRDGESYEYDIVMLLKDFFWANQNLFLAAYIDGHEIEHRETDMDNIERRWFCIRRVNSEDTEFDVLYVGKYPASCPVYVRLFGIEFWETYASHTKVLLEKYSHSAVDAGGK